MNEIKKKIKSSSSRVAKIKARINDIENTNFEIAQ